MAYVAAGKARRFCDCYWNSIQCRDFVNLAAAEVGLDLHWEGSGVDEKGLDKDGNCIIAVNPELFRASEVDTLLGNPAKAKEVLGWSPKIKFSELVSEMVAEDLKIAQRNSGLGKRSTSLINLG